MSRTYKDRPYRVRFPDSYWKTSDEYESVPYVASGTHWRTKEPYERLAWYSIKKPYIKPKKARFDDTEFHWMKSTPSWWVNMFMNRPQRIASKRWEREIVNYSLWDLAQDNFDPPLIGNKPHIYYH